MSSEISPLRKEGKWHQSSITKHFAPAHPVHRLEHYQVILEVTRYFSINYSEFFLLQEMADYLQISLEQIEFSFDRHRGKTARQALLEYRLNRLCDHMAEDPWGIISKQVKRCGLDSFEKTNSEFEHLFGIDISGFQEQCRVSATTRRLTTGQGRGVGDDDIVSGHLEDHTIETRFHHRG